jgi:hypothetical protein
VGAGVHPEVGVEVGPNQLLYSYVPPLD